MASELTKLDGGADNVIKFFDNLDLEVVVASFNKEGILSQMELLRRPNGVFVAAPTADYRAMWIRDQLYATFAYFYLGEYEKLKQGIGLVFDLFLKYQEKIKLRIASPRDTYGSQIRAKFNSDNLSEITNDGDWADHQLDAIGQFLYIVADLDFKNIGIVRNEQDLEVLQLLVYYLRSVEYWQKPDFGMWEECKIRHSSSIGAVVSGLTYVKKQWPRRLIVPDSLIQLGHEALDLLLPWESRDKEAKCLREAHNHDCDASQLFLIWPYHIITDQNQRDEILSRIINGHQSDEWHKLRQDKGFNRYWGDNYYRSDHGHYKGISAMWPMFFFELSIIYSQIHNDDLARSWFEEGTKHIVNDQIPEAYKNGQPNDHTPLAWAHALALIAFTKLPVDIQKSFTKTPHL